MKYVKAFIAGIVFPATVVPLIYTIVFFSGNEAAKTLPLQFMPLYIPIVFGLWNILYFAVGNWCPVKRQNPRLWIHGASLGLLVALVGVFCIELPKLIFDVSGGAQYLPLVIIPILYGLIWRYIIKYLNQWVGLQDW